MSDKKKLLVVDDEDDFRELVVMCFQRTGLYEISEARDGAEALDQVARQKPDLMLLDLTMPVKDGFEVASELTTKMGTDAPKILIVTGRNILEEDVAILLAGAVGIVRKPVQMDKLIENAAKAIEGAALDADWSQIQ